MSRAGKGDGGENANGDHPEKRVPPHQRHETNEPNETDDAPKDDSAGAESEEAETRTDEGGETS